MLEIGVFHNGSSDLPIKEVNKSAVNDGSLSEVNQSRQRTIVDQIRQGILAEKLGFNYFFLTEHHFQPEGAEFSPNPLLVETAIAAHTKRIRLGQAANILTWWNPLRIAEQAAILDVISGGRLEFGVGRGYQGRETEVLGFALGSSVQDQERNRAYYNEAYEIILKAWTQESFFHQGQFFTIPPVHTRWHHQQTIDYFSMDHVGRTLEQVLAIGEPCPGEGSSAITQSSTTMKELQVFPRPIQQPHPQIWEPITSSRSVKWAASRGINGYFIVEPNSRLKKNIDLYYTEAEKAGWPDRLNRGKFKPGWDCEKRRGVATSRFVMMELPGSDRKKTMERWKLGQELQWDYYGPFGFAAILKESEDEKIGRVTGDILLEKEIGIFGKPEEVAEKILKIKQICNYEDDFLFLGLFETAGFVGAEIEDNMQYFAEEVIPILARECGGLKEHSSVPGNLVPEVKQRG